MSRLKPTDRTTKRLYAKSGNQCAFPDCTEKLFLDNNTENISEICHIEAAEIGGQRYNSASNDDFRRSYDNLIILCPRHHKITDDVSRYPVEYLKEIKTNHEQNVTQNMIEKEPNTLSIAINALADENFELELQDEEIESFSIENKIEFNSILKWKPYINEYKQYQGKINSIYSAFDNSGNGFKKEKLLRIIRSTYLKIKGKYIQNNPKTNESLVVQRFADSILDDVEKELLALAKNNSDNTVIAMPIIMVDAFMRCTILERPPK